MNINKLRGKIVERGMKVGTLATLIGIDRSTMYKKLNEGEKFTIGEARKMKDALEMSNDEACEIFLA